MKDVKDVDHAWMHVLASTMTVAIAGVAIVTIQIWLFEKPPKKPPDWMHIHSYEGALDPSGTVVRVDVYSASRDGNGNSDDFLLQNKIVLRDARRTRVHVAH